MVSVRRLLRVLSSCRIVISCSCSALPARFSISTDSFSASVTSTWPCRNRSSRHIILQRTCRLLDQELIAYRKPSCCWSFSCCCNGAKYRIGIKFGRIVLQVNTHRLTTLIFDLTSHFQDGGHDTISRRTVMLSGEYTYSAWSIIHSYLFSL